MRCSIVAIAVLVLVVAVSAKSRHQEMFENFKVQYGRKYADAKEEAYRYGVFVENMKKAAQLMKVNPKAVFGVNEFADVTAAEFKVRHNGEKVYAASIAARKEVVTFTAEEEARAAGQSQDWRPKGAVTPIKNQGQCGSCWSFSSTGSIEGQWFLAGNTLTSVSEQELVSCDTVDSGCNGGLMDNAWGWLLSAHQGAIVTEASYPYVSGGGNVPACSMSGTIVGATISGHQNIQTTETAMAAFVFTSGPLSIAVDATSWQTYVGGIMTNCISSQIDHGVLIVGFDDNNQPPYWIIKNSWGASWGESGYIRVEKGTDQCLITSLPCSSTVAKGPGPAPPQPTATPSPNAPPTPSGATFQQLTCSDDKCQNCSADVLPQGKCIAGPASSFIATCISNGLLLNEYSTTDCSGSFKQTVAPINQCSIVFTNNQAWAWIENVCSAAPPAPTPAPTPSGPLFVIYGVGQNFPTPPAGYVQASLSDITSSAFINYYNNHSLNDLTQQMAGCCIFSLTDGYLTYEGKFLFPYTNGGSRQCLEQLQNPVYFGAGWYTDISLATIQPSDVAKLGVNTTQFCAYQEPNTFGIFKLSNNPPPAPTPAPPAPPSGTTYVIYGTGSSFSTPPTGYVQASLSDITSSSFVSYYNSHSLNDLTQTMAGCCIFNLTDGYLTYESKYLFPYTNGGARQCLEQLQNPVYFGAGWYTDISLPTIQPSDIAKLGVNPAQFCAEAQPNTFAIFKSSS